MTRLWLRFRIEFWWLLERLSKRVWLRCCPVDQASYGLDWLPVLPSRQRYAAERALDRYEERAA